MNTGFNNQPSAPPAYSEIDNISTSQVKSPNNQRYEQLQQIKAKYEISEDFANKLEMLNGFKIVFIFDDSGSMNTVLQDSPLNQPGAFKATRWDELKYFAKTSIEIASLFDPTGCDVHFLNRGTRRNVNLVNLDNLLREFETVRPSGYTPLTQVLTQVLHENAIMARAECKLLIVIVTDGEPTDNSGRVSIKQFRNVLAHRQPIDRIYVSIVACTDDDSSIDYLNRWDREIKHLDVVDDFRSERDEIRKARGSNYRFSYGDYIVKSLVGSVDPTLDNLDEGHFHFRCSIL